MILFLSFIEVSKIKFVEILSNKEIVFHVTLVVLVNKGAQPRAKFVQISKFLF